jgi:hypothetical protein
VTALTLLLVAGAWFALLGLMLAVLLVARRADEATARQLAQRVASTRGRAAYVAVPARSQPPLLGPGFAGQLRRPLPAFASFLAALLAGSVAGVFAGAVIVNAVKRTEPPAPVAGPWIAPEPTTRVPARPALGNPAPAPLTRSVKGLATTPKPARRD